MLYKQDTCRCGHNQNWHYYKGRKRVGPCKLCDCGGLWRNKMNTIIINGIKIQTDSGDICVSNGRVIVDGKHIRVGDISNVRIEGNINNLQVTGNAEVHGNVGGDIDAGGSVTCGDVEGSIDAGGSVRAKNAKQNIDAGGSVHIG